MALERIPKRLYSLDEVRPGEKSHQVCVLLKDIPGALAKVASVMADANINIKTGSTFYIKELENAGAWSSFIDVSKATKSIEEVEGELRKLDEVLDVIWNEPKPAPFESIHFPTLHGNSRAIIMPIGMFWALWEGFERILMHSGLAAVLYGAGKRVGEYVAIRTQERFKLNQNALISALAQIVQSAGWGITEIKNMNFEKLSATIVVKDCFEAEAWRKKPYTVCHWTRGYLAGYMSTVFGKPIEAVEIKCMAKGDEHCEFNIQTKI